MSSSSPFVDYYALLGVEAGKDPASVSLKAINKAYKKLALKWHPDKNKDDPDAPARFEVLQRSVETLRDENLRRVYDEKYLNIKREQLRAEEMDANTRTMKLDLTRREREAKEKNAQKLAQENRERILQKLRRETESKMQETARPTSSLAPAKRFLTLEEHLARENALIKRMLSS